MEPHRSELFQEGAALPGTGNSSKPVNFTLFDFWGNRRTQNKFSRVYCSVGPHHPGKFTEYGISLRIQVEYAVDQDYIDQTIFYTQVIRICLVKFHVIDSDLRGTLLGPPKHGFAEVNADYLALSTYPTCGNQ
jgi:hypothetical protein